MNDQVVFVLIAIIAVLVLVSFIFSNIHKGKQAAEGEKLLRIEHEKQVAELKNLLLNEKEKKEQELKAVIETAKKDEAKLERLRVSHEKEVAEFKRSYQVEKETKEKECEVTNQLLRENAILKQKVIQKENELIQSELRGELTIPLTQRDCDRSIDAEKGEYAAKLHDIEQPNFFKICNISIQHIQDLKSTNREYADTLFKKVEGGTAILTTSDELHQYKFSFDRKHNAKLQSAFELFMQKTCELNVPLSGDLDIIDWGCGQALGSFLFVDYLLLYGIDDIFVNKIILIEPSEIAVKRGVAIIDKRVTGTSLHPLIKVVNKELDQVEVLDICTCNANVKLHLFSNILDLPSLDIENIFSIISKSQRNKNYFICVSPNIDYQRNGQLDSFFRLFKNAFEATESISKRTTSVPYMLSNNPKDAMRYEIMFFSNIVSLDSENDLNDNSVMISVSHPDNFVLICGGEFAMGSPETEYGHQSDEAQHQVKVSDFYMSRYAVTVDEFRRFVEASGYTDAEKENYSVIDYNIETEEEEMSMEVEDNWRNGFSNAVRPRSEANHPVVYVSWNDAIAYCKWLSEKTGKRFRLPTEAEWEYASRAGTTTPFNTGKNLTTDQANYDGNYPYNNNSEGVYRQNTVAVNSFAPNAWGLYNMHGNVWEWCSDLYGEMYYDDSKTQGTVTNPLGPATGLYRVIRGGGWYNFAESCRSAYRHRYAPDFCFFSVGFRPVFDPSLKDEGICPKPSPVDSSTEQSLQVTMKRGAEFESFKQQTKVTRIHGSQGMEASFEFCSIPVDKSTIRSVKKEFSPIYVNEDVNNTGSPFFRGEFSPEGTLSVQLRQKINKVYTNPKNFGIAAFKKRFGEDQIKCKDGKDYDSVRTCIFNIPAMIPDGKGGEQEITLDLIKSFLNNELKGMHIRETLSSEPIITDNLDFAIKAGRTTIEQIAEKQILKKRVSENSTETEVALNTKTGRPIYMLRTLCDGFEEDVDLQNPVPLEGFVSEIIIDKDFYLGKYPVIQQQWEAIMGNNPSHFKGERLPIERVSWDDAQIFVQKLNALSGKQHYRLPTEEEWEYCCRAGSTSEYYFGDDEYRLGEYAWYCDNSDSTTHPVGQKKPNKWGLYDMAGNVWEWTDSWYDKSRSSRVVRGGSWYCLAEGCRSANRNFSTPGNRDYGVGFRLVFVP